MKLRVNTGKLKNALKFVKAVLSRDSFRPGASYVLLRTKNDKLQMNATDLEHGLTLAVECEVMKEGEALTNGFDLASLASFFSSESVTMELVSGYLVLEGDLFKYQLRVRSLSFPRIEIKDSVSWILKKEDALRFLERASWPCFASFMPNEVLKGCYLILEGDKLKLLSTSGRTAVRRVIRVNKGRKALRDLQFIISGKHINSLCHLFSMVEPDEEILFSFGEDILFVRSSHFLFFSKSLQGTFPHLEGRFEEKGKVRIETCSSFLREAISRLRNLNKSDPSQRLILSMEKGSNELSLETSSSERRGLEKIPATASGLEKSLRIHFDLAVFASLAKNLEGDTVLEFRSKETALKSIDSRGESLIMPLRMEGESEDEISS